MTTAVKARTINSGQSCIAAKRFIVSTEVYPEFERRFVEEMKALRVGDPLTESTDIGPLATEQILKDVESQVSTSVAAGAHLLCGGKRLESVGNFYELRCSPTYFRLASSCEEGVRPGSDVFRAKTIDDAIELANSTNSAGRPRGRMTPGKSAL